MGMGEMPCIATLTLDDITECRDNCSELSSAELDFAMLGIIHSCNKTSPSGRVESQECESSAMDKAFARKPSYLWIVFDATGLTTS